MRTQNIMTSSAASRMHSHTDRQAQTKVSNREPHPQQLGVNKELNTNRGIIETTKHPILDKIMPMKVACYHRYLHDYFCLYSANILCILS